MAVKAFAQWIDHSAEPNSSTKIIPYIKVTVIGNDLGDLETRGDHYINVYNVTADQLVTMELSIIAAVKDWLVEHEITVGLLDMVILK